MPEQPYNQTDPQEGRGIRDMFLVECRACQGSGFGGDVLEARDHTGQVVAQSRPPCRHCGGARRVIRNERDYREGDLHERLAETSETSLDTLRLIYHNRLRDITRSTQSLQRGGRLSSIDGRFSFMGTPLGIEPEEAIEGYDELVAREGRERAERSLAENHMAELLRMFAASEGITGENGIHLPEGSARQLAESIGMDWDAMESRGQEYIQEFLDEREPKPPKQGMLSPKAPKRKLF